MFTLNKLEGPARFFAEHRATHVLAVLGAAFSGILLGLRGARAQGWRRVGWFALCFLQTIQVIGLIRLRQVASLHSNE
jgi:ABC-type proline/glycine betaine transport system permease subunit